MSDGARSRTFRRGEFVVYEAVMAGSSLEEAQRRRNQVARTDLDQELTWEQWFRRERRDPRAKTFDSPPTPTHTHGR